jgi:hypothetical protein
VASASGSEAGRDDEIEKNLRKKLRKGLMVMKVKRNKRCLMWKKSTLLTMLIWDLLC